MLEGMGVVVGFGGEDDEELECNLVELVE